MVPILDTSLFSTDNFVKKSLGMFCNHGISALALLFVIKNQHMCKPTVLFGALVPLICV